MNRRSLARELEDAFAAGVGAWTPGRFEDLALRVFAHQFETNPVYRRFCAARGHTPDAIDRWQDVPLVPTSAFKAVDLTPGPVEAIFRTSGTSRGDHERGRHGVRSMQLYRAACLPTLDAHLRLGSRPIRVLSLIPRAAEAPDSSLAHMVEFAIEAFGAPESASFAHPGRGVDLAGFHRALVDAVDRGDRVWVPGTAFAFVHWIDAVTAARFPAVRLPEGSRVMETGGFKGRTREVGKAVLHRGIEQTLGVPSGWIVNEYGMTELFSQFYDAVVGDADATPAEARTHRGPPWVATRVLDPRTLAPTQSGNVGVLAHYDLANLDSVAAVLTEDQGVADREGGFRLLGRVPGAELRGCSLALEE